MELILYTKTLIGKISLFLLNNCYRYKILYYLKYEIGISWEPYEKNVKWWMNQHQNDFECYFWNE